MNELNEKRSRRRDTLSHRIAAPLAVGAVYGVIALAAHAGTVGHWRFEEGTADQPASSSAGAILDSTTPANNGTAVGGPVYRSSPVPNSTLALEFDGSNDSVKIADGVDFQLTQSLTIEACVNIDNLPTTRFELRQILFRGDDRGGLDPYYLAVMGNGTDTTLGRFYIDPVTGVPNSHEAVHVDITGLSGQWLHLAGVLDHANNTMTAYLNGVAGATLTTTTRPGAALLTGSRPGVSIGSLQTGSGQNIDGLIDEVRLSDTALTPSEFLDCVEQAPVDSDDDEVPDNVDVCPGTVIPESVPTRRLGVNRFALVDDDGSFDTRLPPGGGGGPGVGFSIDDTAGCSCEQIITALDLGRGHTKFGCSISAMEAWVALVTPSSSSKGTATNLVSGTAPSDRFSRRSKIRRLRRLKRQDGMNTRRIEALEAMVADRGRSLRR